jgi:O-antigen ligase
MSSSPPTLALNSTTAGSAALALGSALVLGLAVGVLGPLPVAAIVIALAIIAAAAERPDLAILLLVFGQYVPARTALANAVNLTLSDILLGLVAIGWAVWAVRRRSLVLDRDIVYGILALMAAAPVLSLINSPDKTQSLFGVVRTAELWVLLFVVVLSSIRTTRAVTWVIRGFVFLATFEALFGVYQFVSATGAYVNSSYTRAYGTGDLYSWLDLSISLGCAITYLVADMLVRRDAGAWRWFVLAALVAGTTATYTRGVWLAVLLTLAAMILATRPRMLVVLLVAVTLLVGAIAASPNSDLAKRVVSTTDTSDTSVVSRVLLWQTALNMFWAHPFIGAGPKAFALERDRYAPPGLDVYDYHTTPGASMKVELQSPHNYYLLVASETGTLGLLGYILLFGLLLLRGFRAARHGASAALRSVALGGSGVLVFLLIHALVGDLWTGSLAVPAALFVALLAATCQIHARESSAASSPTAPAQG